jgi:hypothetical protein
MTSRALAAVIGGWQVAFGSKLVSTLAISPPPKKKRIGRCARSCELGSQCCPNECIFGVGKLQGSGFWNEGYMSQGREMGGLVYEQPGNKVDGSCHSKEGSK